MNPTQTQPTPTLSPSSMGLPWSVAFSPIHGEPFIVNTTGKATMIQTLPAATFADSAKRAAFVVRAANDYDRLRAALETIAQAGESGPLSGCDIHDIKRVARAALKGSE